MMRNILISPKKRGRPPSTKGKPGWMLFRKLIVTAAYLDAKKRGLKQQAAFDSTKEVIKNKVPGMPISNSEIRRVLRESMSMKQKFVIIPGRLGMNNWILEVGERNTYRVNRKKTSL